MPAETKPSLFVIKKETDYMFAMLDFHSVRNSQWLTLQTKEDLKS